MPFGHYYFIKLPFGICSAPEYFQRKMSQILDRLEGTLCHMDNVLVYGRNQGEHDDRLTRVLQRIKDVGLMLNKEKCEFNKDKLSCVINKRGISPDPSKTKAFLEMDKPKTTTKLRNF